MSEECSFLLVGERNLKCEVQLMSWSPKRDLIAMTTSTGEVVLHRLSSIEKVWSLPAPGKDALINDICWRPDGGVISVAYNTKENGIAFVGMEKAQVFWTVNSEQFSLKSSQHSIQWFESQEINDLEFERRMASLTFKDYLAQLPQLASKDVKIIDAKLIMADLRFNLLMSCDDHSNILGFAYGIFPIFSVHVATILKQPETSILDLCVTPDFHHLITTVQSDKSHQKTCEIIAFDLSRIFEDILLCNEVSQKACHLVSTLSYMDNVLDCMKESCESVIQEMESKLTNYLINKNLSATIGDEFMHMLMWGKPSEVLEELLLRCISEKSIVKLGTLIESSYTSIQQLLTVNFLLASDTIYYHLIEIKGICTPSILGNLKLFNPSELDEIIKHVGSMFLKAVEMQQVIGKNLQSFKAFFHWLYSALLMLKGSVLDKNHQISQLQLEFVADFIMSSFIHEHEQLKLAGKERHFNLNKVDQYLQNSPLITPIKSSENEWYHLVDTTPCLAHNPLIMDRRPNASLRQIFNEVNEKIGKILNKPELNLNLDDVIHRCSMSLPTSQLHTQQWFLPQENSKGYFLTLLSDNKMPCKEMCMTKTDIASRSTTGARFYFTSSFQSGDQVDQSEAYPDKCSIISVSNYNDTLLTCLLATNNNAHYVTQVSIPQLEQLAIAVDFATERTLSMTSLPVCDATSAIAQYCSVDPMTPVSVTSSGTRKVSCLLGADRRYVRAYDMDQVNDDDDVDVSMATNGE
uniref:Anaphase-promoting complex subunit 4 n=1 Tax=Phallusia mammillata TaxID=59560 RepID=A0A6F9D6Z8_9ASCI|nr:anaphase-promoting complex subunit 4 [Phallusia mammillata]